jgi:hypothetical protein
LYRIGHTDEFLLVARHHGANHDAISGSLGVWRRLRIREDRGAPRLVRWEPFPSRRVRGKEAETAAGGMGQPPRLRRTQPATRRSRNDLLDAGGGGSISPVPVTVGARRVVP